MELTSGSPGVTIGLIDGPVATDHPELNTQNLKKIYGTPTGSCSDVTSVACVHGTFVGGMLYKRA
jgi:hypothetical protein